MEVAPYKTAVYGHLHLISQAIKERWARYTEYIDPTGEDELVRDVLQ